MPKGNSTLLRRHLVEIVATLTALQQKRDELWTRLIIDCPHEGYVIEAKEGPTVGRGNRLCLRCGLDDMNYRDACVRHARQLSRPLDDVSTRMVSHDALFEALAKFPQPLGSLPPS